MSGNECPIMSLPDDMLCQIFSLIKDIPFKMRMETVCKRFQTISKQTNSWNGNDRLELIANFSTDPLDKSHPEDMIKYLADCSSYENNFDYLNGHRMPMNKWPEQIEQLLQRAVVRKLSIHIKGSPDASIAQQVFEVMYNNHDHLRLSYIEFDQERLSFGFMNLHQQHLVSQNLYNLYLWVVSNSVKTLQSIVFSVRNLSFTAEQCDLFIGGIAPCPNLKSFSIKLPQLIHHPDKLVLLSDALVGKPLNAITIDNEIRTLPNAAPDPDRLTEFLLPICQNARGDGITSLKVTLTTGTGLLYGLIDFANTLHPPTTQSLVELWISNGSSINRFVSDLIHLPATFPNLKELHLLKLDHPKLDGALLFNTSFFTVCDETPLVDRKVVMSYLEIEDENRFRLGIVKLHRKQGVQAVYREGEGQSYVTLKKGRGTIVIRKIMVSDYESFSDSEEELELAD